MSFLDNEVKAKERHDVPCVILGLSATGLSVVRTLARKRIPVIGVAVSAEEIGLYSKYLQRKIIAPNISTHQEEFLSFLIDLGKEYDNRPVLIPTADEYLSLMSIYREELSPYFRFMIASRETVDCFLDKEKTAEFSRVHNIPHPYSYSVSSEEEIKELAQRIEYPCIIKPRDSHIWRQIFSEQKTIVINSCEELIREYDQIKKHKLNIILQQIIPGPDSNILGFQAYCNNESQILASFSLRKLRQYPPQFGVGCLTESKYIPETVKLGKKILKESNYKGIVSLCFKLDERRNLPIFLEANIRAPLVGELSIVCGVDVPYINYRNLVYDDNKIRSEHLQENGVKLWNMELDLGGLVRLRKNKEISYLDWVKPLMAKKIAHTYFAWDDLKPWFVVYTRLAKKAIVKLLRIIFKSNKNDSKKSVNQPAQVLHLISSSGLFGAENVLLKIACFFNSGENQSIVCAFHDERNPHLEVIEKAKELGLPTHIINSKGRFDIGAIFKLKKYLEENKIDILHTHNYKSDIIGALAAKLAGVSLVCTAHGFTDVTSVVSVYEKIDRFVLQFWFDRVAVMSNKMLPKLSVNKKKVIPNGIDVSLYGKSALKHRDEIRKKYHINDGEILIGTVGRLSKEKNQLLFLKAVKRIVEKHSNVKTLIIGDGPKKDELFKYVDDEGLKEKVIFTGIISDILPVYQALDLFVLSSITEGVPMAILEAMASKVPVIATCVGGIPDIITNNDTGLLVNSKDTDTLRKHIEDLIKDQDKQRRLRESAYDYVKANYSLKNMCDAYRKVYDEVLNC